MFDENLLKLALLYSIPLACYGFYQHKCRQAARQKALEYGVQALLRDRMLHCYNKYIDAGFAPFYAKENYENMYRQYHELGGNGVMTHLHEEFMALPTEKGA